MSELILDSRWPYAVVDPPANDAPPYGSRFGNRIAGPAVRTGASQVASTEGDAKHWRTLLFTALRRGERLKRACDLTFTLLGGMICLPLVGLIALAIKFGSRGPIFFSHERIGRFGHRFEALKFRTMVTNGDEVLAAHLAANPEAREEWRRDHKLKRDPRITFIGGILRKTSLDELPQLWNVVRGEMSLIGPRPIVHAEISKYGDDFDVYLQALPGITGLWQVSGRNDTSYRQRVSLDVEYVVTWSIWTDVMILLRTALVVVRQTGAY
jgi:Undecaprenyl-phosphate galactose phosphotransferase WbaP